MTHPPDRTPAERLRLDGKVALVTGAGGHIGGAVCRALHSLGATVVGIDRDQASLDRLQLGGESHILTHRADLEREDEVRGIERWLSSNTGDVLDVVVCAAAFVGSD